MAYGKAPQASNQGSFRQRANQYQQGKEKSRKRGGGGGGVYWQNQYKPSMDNVDTIRIIEGKYMCPQIVGEKDDAKVEMVELPFFTLSEHYDGREEKSSICSAGPWAGSKKKSEPCYGCEIFWAGMGEKDHNGKKKQGRMSRREMYAFTVIDYGVYHHVPQTDFKTGQIRTKDDGTPWMEWKKCEATPDTPQSCSGCRSAAETRRGARLHWQLGWGHYQTLLDADKQIGKSCSNCCAANSIVGIAWTCAACGDAIVDMATTTLKPKEIDELVGKNVTCTCGHTGFAQEIIECRSCTGAGGTAKRATIFDVDMNVKRVADPNGGNATTLAISQWSTPAPIDPLFKEFAEPIDLAKVYAPTPLEKQRELFRYTPGSAAGAVQRTPVTAGDAARPYGNQQAPQGAPQPQGTPAGGFPGQAWSPPGMQPQQQQAWQQPAPQPAPQGNPWQQPQAAPPPQQQPWQPPQQGFGAPQPAPAETPPGFLPPPK